METLLDWCNKEIAWREEVAETMDYERDEIYNEGQIDGLKIVVKCIEKIMEKQHKGKK